MAWTPWGNVDLIPGVNVGAGFRQLFGGQDEDVLEGISTGNKSRTGQLHIGGIPDVGVRVSASNPTGQEQPTGQVFSNPVEEANIGGGGAITPDPYALMRARADSEAKGIKDRILGRGSEIDAILNDIMGRVDNLLSDKKRTRQGQYDTDSAALIDSLNAAIPEIQKAFAALGLSSSTFVGDRVDNTNQEYKKSQEGVDTQFNNDLATYGQWAESEKGNAKASADKARNDIEFVKNADANADNLSRFQESERSFNNALTDFGAQRNNYTTSGDALKRLEGIGSDYDFSKILDSFGSLAASSANTGTGGGAAQAVLDNIRGVDPKNKKKLSEVQVNNPVGAATS